MKKNIWEAVEALVEKGMDFDVSDSPQEPAPAKRKGPPPVPVRPNAAMANRKHSYNPGMPPVRQKNEAPIGLAPASQADMAARRNRQSRPTMPMIPQAQKPAAPAGQGPGKFEVSTPAGELFHVDASSAEEAKQLVVDMMADEMARTGHGGASIDVNKLKARPVAMEGVAESTTGANGAGFQLPMGDAAEAAKKVYENALKQVFRETVRKLPNGKYGVYVKNKGKKKAPKKVGEYPDRVAAREAELARGGKSGDAAKKERDRLSKLKKDPKKLAAAKKKDKTKAKSTKESIITAMVQGMNEALFREEDIPGSPWDERLAGLSPNALASDKKLAGHAKAIDRASGEALMDAVAMLQKALKKQCKCRHGELGTETGGKMFVPVTLDIDGEEHGPLYMYVDGGHVRLEMADELDESLDGLEDGLGHNILGAIMSFRQKQLPKIDKALRAVAARDAHLDKMDRAHDEHLSGLSGVDLQIIKNLINTKHGRRFR